LVVVYAVYSLNAPAYYIASGIGQAWIGMVGAVLGGALTIALIVALAPHFGIEGAAAANGGYAASLVIVAYVYRQLSGPAGWNKRVTSDEEVLSPRNA